MAYTYNKKTHRYEDEDGNEEEYEEVEKVIHIDEQEQEQEQEDYTQEAFTPSFNVAPEIVPEEAQVHIPTEEEKKSTLEKMYARLGVEAKKILTEEVEELSPETLGRVNKTSLMAARIFSSICMWGWSIFGIEYQIVAPTVEQSQKMIEPILRITARHAPIVGNISPDVDDVIEAGTAISDYALYAMAMMQQIREDKLANGGRYTGTFRSANGITTSENGLNGNSTRSNDYRGFTTVGNEPTQDTRYEQHTNPEDHLTENERYNRDMLSQLRARDMQSRARKSGRI